MNSSASPADFLAAERTFLAWIRTGLALMGLGFVVARFGIFLQTLQLGQPQLPQQPYGLSFWFGTVLILLGVAIQALSAFNHVGLVRRLASGEAALGNPSTLAVTVAVALAVLGLAMAVYLISVRGPSAQRVGWVQPTTVPVALGIGTPACSIFTYRMAKDVSNGERQAS